MNLRCREQVLTMYSERAIRDGMILRFDSEILELGILTVYMTLMKRRL